MQERVKTSGTKRILTAAAMATLWLAGLGYAADTTGDWPNFHGPDYDGISKDTNWNPNALASTNIVWRKNVGKGFSNFSVKNDTVFTMGNNGKTDTVFCLRLKDGSEVWKTSYACEPAGGGYPGPRSTPTLDGESVYTLSNLGHLRCLNMSTGAIRWQKNLIDDFQALNIDWGFSGSPRVSGDMLIINAGLYGLALNKYTGEKIWSSPAGRGGYATPVIYKGPTGDSVAIFGQKAAYGVELKTGRKLWSFDWVTFADVNASDPIITGTQVFISSCLAPGNMKTGSVLLDISGDEPKPVWTNTNIRCYSSTGVLIGGMLYGIDGPPGDGTLKCIELATGETKWNQKFGAAAAGLTAVHDKLIVLTERGDLFVAEAAPAAYKEIAAAKGVLGPICRSFPVFCRGMILCRNNNGDIVCIDVNSTR